MSANEPLAEVANCRPSKNTSVLMAEASALLQVKFVLRNEYLAAYNKLLTSVVEQAIHLWWFGATLDYVLDREKRKAHGNVPRTHLWCTGVIRNNIGFYKAMNIFIKKRSSPERRETVRTEQDSVRRVWQLLKTSPRPKHILVALCSGTIAMSTMCMAPQKHSRLTGCKISGMLFHASRLSEEEGCSR